MHSSTSSSNAAVPAWGIPVLLCAIAGVGLMLEFAAIRGVKLVNHNQLRISREYADARELGHGETDSRIPVLFLGNSLTLTDLDMSQLASELGPRYHVTRLAVEETGYLDWYFGLRRLFREGSRPGIIVVGAQSYHLTKPRVRGLYFARHLLDRADILEAGRRTHSDATGTSDLAIGHFSAFYGQREEINKKLLHCLIPDFGELAPVLAQGVPSSGGRRHKLPSYLSRLRELKALCNEYGAQLVVWMPPHPDVDPGAPAVIAAGKQAGVPILIPVAHNQIPPYRFPDGEHLDPTGALVVTRALSPELRPLLLKVSNRLASIGTSAEDTVLSRPGSDSRFQADHR